MARINTDIQNALLAHLFHGLAVFLKAHFQVSLLMVPQKFRSIFFANEQQWPIKAFWREALSAGFLAQRGSDGFLNPVQARL